MKVYTYFEDLGWPERRDLLNLWRRTWYNHGWEPVVLTIKDAKANLPLFNLMKVRVETYPTANDPNYEFACYIRHLAMANVGGGLLTDFDVLNFGFHPTDITTSGFLDNKYCPGAVVGSQSFYLKLCLILVSWNPNDCQEWEGKKHLSDMVIFRKCEPSLMFGPPMNICRTLPEDGWKTALLVHFPTGIIPPEASRLEFISERMKEIQ